MPTDPSNGTSAVQLVLNSSPNSNTNDRSTQRSNFARVNQPLNMKAMLRSNLSSLKDEAKALFTFHPSEWISAFRSNRNYPWFTVGDIDAFVALFMNNLATLLAVILGLQLVFDDELVYGKIVPGFEEKNRFSI